MPMLRTELLNALRAEMAVQYAGQYEGDDAPAAPADDAPLEIFLLGADGERTRFSGRSQLDALKRAAELLVVVGAKRVETNGHGGGGRLANGVEKQSLLVDFE